MSSKSYPPQKTLSRTSIQRQRTYRNRLRHAATEAVLFVEICIAQNHVSRGIPGTPLCDQNLMTVDTYKNGLVRMASNTGTHSIATSASTISIGMYGLAESGWRCRKFLPYRGLWLGLLPLLQNKKVRFIIYLLSNTLTKRRYSEIY